MQILEGRGFFSQLYSTVFERSQKKKVVKEDKPSPSILHMMKTMIHVMVRSNLSAGTAGSAEDYMKQVLLVLKAGFALSLGAICFFYTQVFLMPMLLVALQAGDAVLFYYSFKLVLAAYSSAIVFRCLCRIYDSYIKVGVIFRVRSKMIDLKAQGKNALDVDKDSWNRVFSKSLSKVAEILPLLVRKFLVLAIQFGMAMAVLELQLLYISVAIGSAIQLINWFIKDRAKRVNDEMVEFEKDMDATFSAQLEANENMVRIQAQGFMADQEKQAVIASFLISFKSDIYQILQKAVTDLSSNLSKIIYYGYFAASLFAGLMTITQILILLPLCESLSDCAGMFFAITPMLMVIRKEIDVISGAWNSVAQGEDRVPKSFSGLQMSLSTWVYSLSSALVAYMVITPLVTLKTSMLVISTIAIAFSTIVLFPSRTLPQLMIGALLMSEYTALRPIKWLMQKPALEYLSYASVIGGVSVAASILVASPLAMVPLSVALILPFVAPSRYIKPLLTKPYVMYSTLLSVMIKHRYILALLSVSLWAHFAVNALIANVALFAMSVLVLNNGPFKFMKSDFMYNLVNDSMSFVESMILYPIKLCLPLNVPKVKEEGKVLPVNNYVPVGKQNISYSHCDNANPSKRIRVQATYMAGKINLITATNGTGKTTSYTDILSGCFNPSSRQDFKFEGSEKALFSQESTLSVRGELTLPKPYASAESRTILNVLSKVVSVNERTLSQYLGEKLEVIGCSKLMQKLTTMHSACWEVSKGEGEILKILSILAKLKGSSEKYRYFVLDEALTGLSVADKTGEMVGAENLRGKVYNVISEELSTWCNIHQGTAVIIQHGLTDEVKGSCRVICDSPDDGQEGKVSNFHLPLVS